MSLFLGKIHYWLFNKIVWFENLEEDLISIAKTTNLDVDSLKKRIDNKYGEKLPEAPLEDIIDKGNIHGWLQGKIHSAEGRLASWIVELQKVDNIESEIEKIFINQGRVAAEEVKEEGKSCDNAIEIFNSMNDYILDGMPCDRVNEVVISEPSLVKWERRICVHKDIWNEAGGDVEYFYKLRSLWIKSFVSNVNSNFTYNEEDGFRIIEK